MHYLKGFVIPFVILILWLIGSATESINQYIIPPPTKVLQTALDLTASGILLKHITISLYRVFAGFLLTVLFAFPLAILVGINQRLAPYIDPVLDFLGHIPPISCIPILILWFGIGETSKLAVIILATFFPVFLNTLNGILGCNKQLLEVGDVFGFTARDKFLRIVIPAALPSIIVGFRLGLGYSWRSLIGAELIAASSGIGYMIIDAEQLSRPDIIIVGILTIGLFGYIIDYCFFKLTNHLIPWAGKRVSYGRS
ncbi:binding-protein-dependent transport systems inner membrane component [Desulforamulus reducens MI-1]|uniref:Binding-protein-dependent transport systems inner membrane component n=1 Tax=Desulforamulus reducens (strain ATCC BAA-1160 / DSM 100696 / MI-1) TaxID=349161 RepID=A4J4V0_DESRM|nr:ABC transporter permease [Desulforamulus reducens]ABO50103.1 binding-protein-dependent transport systems inner membrane component [Desulforamulus reducens MI-1]